MNIVGKKVVLRAMEKSDLELVREMLNDRELEHLVIGWSFPISAYQQEKWYEVHSGDQRNLRFMIDTEDGVVGLATLVDIDWKNRRARHGIKIMNPNNRGKGIGKDTLMALMRYAFDELQLVRLDTSWFTDNTASKTLYTKCGWKEEGLKRNYIYQNGSYKDVMMTGILAEDYYKLIEENHYWDNED